MVFRKPMNIAIVLKRPMENSNGFWGEHRHWMFFGGLTIAFNGFSMVFGLASIAFNGFRWFGPLVKRCDGFNGSLWSTLVLLLAFIRTIHRRRMTILQICVTKCWNHKSKRPFLVNFDVWEYYKPLSGVSCLVQMLGLKIIALLLLLLLQLLQHHLASLNYIPFIEIISLPKLVSPSRTSLMERFQKGVCQEITLHFGWIWERIISQGFRWISVPKLLFRSDLSL